MAFLRPCAGLPLRTARARAGVLPLALQPSSIVRCCGSRLANFFASWLADHFSSTPVSRRLGFSCALANTCYRRASEVLGACKEAVHRSIGGDDVTVVSARDRRALSAIGMPRWS